MPIVQEPQTKVRRVNEILEHLNEQLEDAGRGRIYREIGDPHYENAGATTPYQWDTTDTGVTILTLKPCVYEGDSVFKDATAIIVYGENAYAVMVLSRFGEPVLLAEFPNEG